jgi:hypothetical protein
MKRWKPGLVASWVVEQTEILEAEIRRRLDGRGCTVVGGVIEEAIRR